MTSEAFAPAKINLTLHVTGQRDDGYHLLDSLVMFADIGDRLTFSPAPALTLHVDGPFAQGVPTDQRNSVMQAASLAGAYQAITLAKNLPHGAGIGGGSSDAAAVFRHFQITEGAAKLGADVPVCLLAKAQRMQGIGEVLTPLPDMPSCAAVLVNPGVHIPTPQVFKALKNKANPAMPPALPALNASGDLISWLRLMRNDLEPPALSVSPVINDVLTALANHSALVRMSGSGATCFALFEARDQADQVAARLAQAHPNWWVRPTTLS